MTSSKWDKAYKEGAHWEVGLSKNAKESVNYLKKKTKLKKAKILDLGCGIRRRISVDVHGLLTTCLMDKKIKKRDYIKYEEKYCKLSETTKTHILVHAILKEVLLKLYREKQARTFIKKYDKWPDYKKAWEIVEQEGSKKIIKERIE